MLVDVVLLRMGGVKLHEYERAPPVRGHLSIDGDEARVTPEATSAGTERDLVPPLKECRLYRASGDALLLHGLEATGWPHRYGARQLQAWWCRLVRK